jgi:fluoroquinolone transport system permease protein
MMQWDVRIQAKYGLYIAGFVMTCMWFAVLLFFEGEALTYAVPIVLLTDVGTMGLMFVGAMLYFEKGQGSINAVVTTPLKVKEYILSKVISLTLFVVLYATLLVAAISQVKGLHIHWFYLMLSIILLSVLYTLGGILLSTLFKTFTDFVFPMGLVLGLFNIPLFSMIGNTFVTQIGPIFYLFPTYGSVLLLRGVYTPPTGFEVLYSVLYISLWCWVLFKLCIKQFNVKIIGRTGDIDG